MDIFENKNYFTLYIKGEYEECPIFVRTEVPKEFGHFDIDEDFEERPFI